jgi:hypothetical protein
MKVELKAKAKKLKSGNVQRVAAIAEELMKVYKLTVELHGSIFEEWKRKFLNYTFLGCLPT